MGPCSASVKSIYTKAMESEKRIYSSQLADCQSSEASSGESEKPSGSSGSISGNTYQAISCSSAEIQKKSSACLQEMAASAGGDVCDAWQTFENCLTGSFASCGSDTKDQISTMISSMKT